MKKIVLAVEDNPINRAMLVEILSPTYEVLEAENGQEALSVLRERGESISLVLLDIIMPVMDGYTFLSHLMADRTLSTIPVIVTTQSDGDADEVNALAHGATDFVTKPYHPQIILHRVAGIIKLRETAAIINLVQHDRLTGLYSKEFFYQQAREVLLRHPDRQYDVICSDIERFKMVNDIFGIAAGDRLLCGMADLYRELMSTYGICGRLGADQFACLIEHKTEYTDEMFMRVRDRLSCLPNAQNIIIKWGVYEVEDRALPIEQMCDRALMAAERIKGRYGIFFTRYDEALRQKLLREQNIMDGMERALAESSSRYIFSPNIALATAR